MEDEDGRQLPQVDFLVGLHLFLALLAKPLLATSEEFLLEVFDETVRNFGHFLRHRQGKVKERIEAPRMVAAFPACHRRPQLALEHVHQEGFAALEIPHPRERRSELLAAAFDDALVGLLFLLSRRRRPLGDAVEILVEAIQTKGKELLHVLLLAAFEKVWRETCKLPVQLARVQGRLVALPHVSLQPGERMGQLSFTAEAVADVHVLFIAAAEKVRSEGL
mmetsp:Transcript_88111/g.247779  ORF Transcript_88111/g.247779 Transcript_88111/m.247779 type:complete len:221 (+) Transcript_88111:1026-1688(+)